MSITSLVLASVANERSRQNDLVKAGKIPFNCSDPSIPTYVKLAVLTEENGEVNRAVNDNETKAQLYTELIQVAAVAVAIAESLLPVD